MQARYYAPRVAGSARAGQDPRGWSLVGVDGNAEEPQPVAADHDLVAVLEHLPLDARPVHEHAIQAAVVEPAPPVGLTHDQGVPPGDGRIVEAHVRREAASDARPLACQRDRLQLVPVFVGEILAWLLQPLTDVLQPLLAVDGLGMGQRATDGPGSERVHVGVSLPGARGAPLAAADATGENRSAPGGPAGPGATAPAC